MTLHALRRLCLGAVLFAAACSTKDAHLPASNDSLLVEVLVDLHLLDARSTIVKDVQPGRRDSVLWRHGLDSAGFEAAMRRYLDHPEAYEALYGRVVDRLNAERIPLDTL